MECSPERVVLSEKMTFTKEEERTKQDRNEVGLQQGPTMENVERTTPDQHTVAHLSSSESARLVEPTAVRVYHRL